LKVDKELQDAMNKLGTVLEMNRKDQLKVQSWYKGNGDKIKLYGRRDGNRQKVHFYSDIPSRERMAWCLNVIETVLGVKLSATVLLRRAIISLEAELLDLLMNHKGTDPKHFNEYLNTLEIERKTLYACANTEIIDVSIKTTNKKQH
jgi:hypothetical protein